MKKIIVVDAILAVALVVCLMMINSSWYYDYIVWWMRKFPMIYGRLTPEFMIMDTRIGCSIVCPAMGALLNYGIIKKII